MCVIIKCGSLRGDPAPIGQWRVSPEVQPTMHTADWSGRLLAREAGHNSGQRDIVGSSAQVRFSPVQ